MQVFQPDTGKPEHAVTIRQRGENGSGITPIDLDRRRRGDRPINAHRRVTAFDQPAIACSGRDFLADITALLKTDTVIEIKPAFKRQGLFRGQFGLTLGDAVMPAQPPPLIGIRRGFSRGITVMMTF